MTLVALMYHRASAGPHGNAPDVLDAHFASIAKRFHCVLPGEPLADDRLNVCLTFDDGTYDFRAIVYPLLAKHRLRAVLAIPASFAREERVDDAAADAHCTWNELVEMSASGRVSIAAHGLTHRRLDRPDVDLDAEVVAAKTILSARLGRTVDTFVLPYGRFDRRSLDRIASEYRYVFRIGSADNANWDAPLLYRVDADRMDGPEALFAPVRLGAYRLRRRWNQWRRR